MQEGIEELLRAARPGDAILTIGAGNASLRAGRIQSRSIGREGFHIASCELAIPN